MTTSPFVGTNPEALGSGLPCSVTMEPKARTQDSATDLSGETAVLVNARIKPA